MSGLLVGLTKKNAFQVDPLLLQPRCGTESSDRRPGLPAACNSRPFTQLPSHTTYLCAHVPVHFILLLATSFLLQHCFSRGSTSHLFNFPSNQDLFLFDISSNHSISSLLSITRKFSSTLPLMSAWLLSLKHREHSGLEAFHFL